MPVKTSYDLVQIIHFIQRFRVPVRTLWNINNTIIIQIMFRILNKCEFVCVSACLSAPYVLVYHFCASKNVHRWTLCYDGGYSDDDPDQRSFYFWMQTGYREHIMPPAEQDTCNRPLTAGHFESLSPSLRAGANPRCVYHKTGTTAGWSVRSLPWTSWSADTYGYNLGWCALIWISTNGLRGGISACTVSHVHLRRYMRGSAQSGALNRTIAIGKIHCSSEKSY